MLAGKKLTGFTNSFSPHDIKKNDSIILSYFKNEMKVILLGAILKQLTKQIHLNKENFD